MNPCKKLIIKPDLPILERRLSKNGPREKNEVHMMALMAILEIVAKGCLILKLYKMKLKKVKMVVW